MRPPHDGLRPKLSLVIPTTDAWPQVDVPIASAWEQLQAIGGELIVAHRGDGLPAAHDYPGLIQVSQPGASVFQLRTLGTARATGEIVAVTEDHTQVAPDYCEQVLAVHAEHPDMLAIGGAVENGSYDPIAWASYFVSQIRALPPEVGPWRAPLTGIANVTFKRSFIDQHGAAATQAVGHLRTLHRERRAYNDPRIRVLHIQSLGFARTCAVHFHDARHIGDNRRRALSGKAKAIELAKELFPLRPTIMTGRLLSRVARQYPSLRRELAQAAPMVALLAACHCAGELAGFVTGVGTSAHRIP